jgi:glycosyltransferase involved in cell wall biosynthesis
MKVIHIDVNSPAFTYSRSLFKEDWSDKFCRKLLMKSRINIEIWKTCPFLTQIKSKKGRIVYKFFPSIYFRFSCLRAEFSHRLLKFLQQKIEKRDRVIFHLHDPSNLGTLLMLNFLGRNALRETPLIAQSYGRKPSYYFLKSNQLQYLPKYLLEKRVFPYFDKVYVLSQEEEAFFSHELGDIKVRVQPMGIDTDIFKPMSKEVARKRLGLSIDKTYLLYVGRFVKMKGLDYLLEGLMILKKRGYNLNLVLVGDGPYRHYLKFLIHKFGLEDNVLLVGWKTPEQLSYYYNSADIFVFPSLSETWGLAPLEAMACGTPVIATYVGAIKYLIQTHQIPKKQKFVFSIPIRNTNAIVNNVINILQQRPSKKEIPVFAQEIVKKFSWNEVIKKRLKIIKSFTKSTIRKMT